MANYSEMDESELQKMLSEADSYEERSLIRQALRQKKKQKGGVIGRSRGGSSVYNRFAATTRSTAPTPKNFVAAAAETPKTEPVVSKPSKPTSSPQQQVDIPPNVKDNRSPSPPPSPKLSSTPPSPEPPQDSPEPPQESPSSPEPPQESPPSPEPPEESPPSPDPPQESPPSPEPPEESPPSPDPPQESPEPPQEPSSEAVDGVEDPGLGEEGSAEDTLADQESEPAPEPEEVAPPKSRERAIEESDGGSRRPKSESRSGQQPSVDFKFGVKLKKTPPQTKAKPSPSGGGGGPRTMRDYQEIAARTKLPPKSGPSDEQPMQVDELQMYLVAYVNRELNLSPALPTRGRALFEVASDPTNLCKLINKSVPNTVDLRALTKVPVRGSVEAKREALEENMVLVVESARAIGCRVTDTSGEEIIKGDPTTIRQFLVDLIRARVVHMPGMDEEDSSTFTNMATLFSKLGISVDSADGEEPPADAPEEAPPKQETAPLTYEERAALRRAEREKKRSDDPSGEKPEMTYEERAAQRRLERERRRKEREALAK